MRPHEFGVLPQGQDTTLIHKYKPNPNPNPNLLGLQEALLALTLTPLPLQVSILTLTHPSPHNFFEDISWRLHEVVPAPNPPPILLLTNVICQLLQYS